MPSNFTLALLAIEVAKLLKFNDPAAALSCDAAECGVAMVSRAPTGGATPSLLLGAAFEREDGTVLVKLHAPLSALLRTKGADLICTVSGGMDVDGEHGQEGNDAADGAEEEEEEEEEEETMDGLWSFGGETQVPVAVAAARRRNTAVRRAQRKAIRSMRFRSNMVWRPEH